MLINTDWLKTDRITTQIVDAGHYTAELSDSVDNNIKADCKRLGITIPVDGSGYIDDENIRAMAENYALFKLLFSYSSVRDNDSNVLREQATYYEQQYRISLQKLSTLTDNIKTAYAGTIKDYCRNDFGGATYDELPFAIKSAIDILMREDANRPAGVGSKTSQGVMVESYTAADFPPIVRSILGGYRKSVSFNVRYV